MFWYEMKKGKLDMVCALVESVLRSQPFLLLAGRGLKSHAYIHSVQFSHHVFLNLHTLKFYCLPDNYEIIDSSLEDITVRVQEGWFGTSSLGSYPRAPGIFPTQGQERVSGLWTWRISFLFGRNQGN